VKQCLSEVDDYAADHSFMEAGMIEKAKEFVESGGEIYQGV
jgi:hypothetical protein